MDELIKDGKRYVKTLATGILHSNNKEYFALSSVYYLEDGRYEVAVTPKDYEDSIIDTNLVGAEITLLYGYKRLIQTTGYLIEHLYNCYVYVEQLEKNND